MRFNNKVGSIVFAALLASTSATFAAEQIFENWNTAACALTDTAVLTIDRPVHLDALELWYRWGADESGVEYTVDFNGQTIGDGVLERKACDPYQAAWCIARGEPGADLVPGTYTFKTKRAQVCQNGQSGGKGFIRVFGSRK